MRESANGTKKCSGKATSQKNKKHVCVAIGALLAYRRTTIWDRPERVSLKKTFTHNLTKIMCTIIRSSCCCCCFLTLTDPLRIQPWSQDRRNQTKSNRESEISMESRQKRTDKEVASTGHRRDKIENISKNTQTVETN